MILRPYQQEARDAIHEEWKTNNKTLLVLPTGTGKTVVFASVIKDRVANGSKALVLAHRGELLDQAAGKLKAVGLDSALEKADSHSAGSVYPVTVGSVQSMMRPARLDEFPSDYFDTIVVDEAHHSISDSYQAVLKHFSGAKVLGVTATPDRGDMRNLGAFYESKAYEYTLPAAIHDGYLCPIKAQTIPLKLDISHVGVQAGDFKAREIGHALDPYLKLIAEEMTTYCAGRKTVVFLPLVATSQKFCEMLQAQGFKAAEVNGNSTDRAEILRDFEAGKYDVLCNSMLLTEGWDCPSVDCIVVLRPTKVRSLYAQMVGRGTRIAKGKDYLLLLDFLWHTQRHDLCHPAHLICESEVTAHRMTKKLEKTGNAIDITLAKVQAEKEAVLEREAKLARELEAKKNKKRKLVDPLQFEMSIQAEDLAGYVPSFGWEMKPPTEPQKQALESRGINPEEVDSAGKASLIIKKCNERRRMNLATPKQMRVLEQKGFRHVGTWTFEEAQKMISVIANNGWRVPNWIDPWSYKPMSKEERELGWTSVI